MPRPPSENSTQPPIHLQHPPVPSVCRLAPPRSPLLAIRANFPATGALVLAIRCAALQINVLLPWHQVLVALGSSFDWPARDYYAFHNQQLQKKPTSPSLQNT